MTNGNYDRLNGMNELKFYRRGSQVNPADLFTEMYSPLEQLIKYNRQVFLNSKKFEGKMSIGTAHPGHDAKLEELSASAAKSINDTKSAGGFAAVAKFADGKTTNFVVSPRTNYDPSLVKSPNIIYLLSDGATPDLILREARVHDEETTKASSRLARALVVNNYKGNIVERIEKDETLSTRSADVFSVPEPYLTLALEQAHLEQAAPRLLPSAKVVAASDNAIWYVRNFLPAIRDSSVESSDVPAYFGKLHGLGLFDSLDMQVVHYCFDKGKIVNIDPDFMLFSRSYNLVDHQAWGALKREERKSDGEWHDTKIIPTDYLNSSEAREIYKAAKKESLERLSPEGLLKYIPKSLTTAPALNSISIAGK